MDKWIASYYITILLIISQGKEFLADQVNHNYYPCMQLQHEQGCMHARMKMYICS